MDKTLATPAVISTTFNPTPITNSVTEIVVEPLTMTVSTDSNFVIKFHNFYIFF